MTTSSSMRVKARRPHRGMGIHTGERERDSCFMVKCKSIAICYSKIVLQGLKGGNFYPKASLMLVGFVVIRGGSKVSRG